jgi:rhodanese-related sulfurtransferase
MSLPRISPQQAKAMLDDGGILVDIREPDEHARERIAEAKHMPLSLLDDADLSVHRGRPVIFHCRTGARTIGHAPRLAAKVGGECQAYIVDGGIDAWRRAGLPVVSDRRQPLELMRQVQIAAGSLAFFGTLLGLLVSPWFFAVPLFVGAGLMNAGITGFCGLAIVLMRMPWNRATYGTQIQKA